MGRLALVAALALLVGCSGAMDDLDGGPLVDANTEDAGSDDAGGHEDGAVLFADAGVDAGLDGGALDASGEDAGIDAGALDAGLDAGAPDAGPPDTGVDAGPPDAGTDAGPPDAGADAGPPDAGADAGPPICYASDLVIAAIDPGHFGGSIAIYNASGLTIRVDETDYLLHEDPDSVLLRDLAPGVELAPGTLHRFPYPSVFSDGDASGELALYRDTGIRSPTSMVDFVCWGFGHSPSFTVRPVAVEGGHWSGGCTSSIIGLEMRRVTGTDGTTRASYDHEGRTSLFTCD